MLLNKTNCVTFTHCCPAVCQIDRFRLACGASGSPRYLYIYITQMSSSFEKRERVQWYYYLNFLCLSISIWIWFWIKIFSIYPARSLSRQLHAAQNRAISLFKWQRRRRRRRRLGAKQLLWFCLLPSTNATTRSQSSQNTHEWVSNRMANMFTSLIIPIIKFIAPLSFTFAFSSSSWSFVLVKFTPHWDLCSCFV